MFGHTTTILESQPAAADLSNRNQCNEQLNFHTTSLAKSLSVQVHIVRMQCFFLHDKQSKFNKEWWFEPTPS